MGVSVSPIFRAFSGSVTLGFHSYLLSEALIAADSSPFWNPHGTCCLNHSSVLGGRGVEMNRIQALLLRDPQSSGGDRERDDINMSQFRRSTHSLVITIKDQNALQNRDDVLPLKSLISHRVLFRTRGRVSI